MRKVINLLICLVSGGLFAQNQIIYERDIPELNSIIKSLEKKYNESDHLLYNSWPQTTASYFKIVTKTPDTFLTRLKKSENLQQLKNEFGSLQVDEDLLVIKNEYLNNKNEKKIEIKSSDIENSSYHLLFNEYYNVEQIFNPEKKIKVYYSVHQEKVDNPEGATSIFGFYLNDEFKATMIPKEYSNWVTYTDIIVKPEAPIFHKNKERSYEFVNYNKTIIDSLVNYYETKTNKPVYRKDQDYLSRSRELDEWQSKKQKYTDSLFNADRQFKKLLMESLSYAEENKVSNGDLEDFTAELISKNRALELMRQNAQVGSCSFDDGPVIQQKRMATLAAQTKNWEVFIKSFLNVMNDNVSRIANSNIASNSRDTYINELAKLDLNIDKILLGSNLRIDDTINKHYFSDGGKIAQAYANLDSENQNYFEKTIFDIISNKSMDAFNKLHFYNTFKSYQYFVKDSLKKNEIEKSIEKLVPLLPIEIRSRIENPNKQLYDLLYREKNELDKFEISSSIIAFMYSYYYDGYFWKAVLSEKDSNGKILYVLRMAIGEEITPLQNFLVKKDELKSRVLNHFYIQQILNQNSENKLNINFTNNKSFANFKNKELEEMPKELSLTLDFNDAISFYILFQNRYSVSFLLLNNGNLLITDTDIPMGFELPGYKFEQLMTKAVNSFLSIEYQSFKMFDEKGKMLN